MSHTTTIETVVIGDINALKLALQDMSRAGIRCSLEENAKPRAYYDQQAGMERADYVVRLPDAQYDVGLYKTDNGYEARTDFYGGSVAKVLGADKTHRTAADNPRQADLGKLYQSYAVCAAEQQAARMGHSVQRQTLENGTVQLILNA